VTGLLFLILGILVVVWSVPTTPLPGQGATANDWFREVSPAGGSLAALRLMILAGLSYLMAATVLAVASAMLHSDALDRTAAGFTGPGLQRFLRTTVGLGIGTVTSLQSIAAGAAPPPVEESSEPIPAASAEPTADETTTLTRIDGPALSVPAEGDVGDTAVATARAQAPVPTPPASPAEAERADATDWWTVAPGDHLWHIAEETLLDHGDAAPSLDEVAAYWHILCQANHGRLVDPDNPDLIMPGQQIVLPPTPARS
jgi:hypothetical protein